MSTKLRGLLVLCGILVGGILFAQEKTVTGTVTDSNGFPLADVSVTTSSGQEVFTDMDGNYSIETNANEVLKFESLGLEVATATVGAANTYNVTLRESSAIELEGAVVTALGITREKRSLGYGTQEVSGETISAAPVTNFADAMSGEVAGLDIKSSGTMGGSANIIIRGFKSITGDNQALIVVDGTPINNSTFNTSDQITGRGGYDYGNAAMDINPNDIESVNVLKGAAATALYGSRAGQGVIMITTKKGKRGSGIGVEVNSSFTVGTADKETLPTYQKQYGAGYGVEYFGDFYYEDLNGDGIAEPITQVDWDGSYGAAFDPDLMIYQWDALYPQLPTYMTPRPWVAGANSPNTIWKPSTTYVNSASFNGGNDDGSFRLGFTNYQQNGNLRNSRMLKNTIDFNGSYNLTDKLTVSATLTYVNNSGKGLYGTGYDSRNQMQTFRQWWQTNVDMDQQLWAYNLTGQNITWNPTYVFPGDLGAIYHDNYFWMRDNDVSSVERDRYFGNASLNYEINDWLSVLGRFTFDNYNELREEKTAVGSTSGTIPLAGEYWMMKQNVSENNYDVILSIDKDLTEDINLDADIGWNLRVQDRNSFTGITNGGLKVPGLYTLNNSINPLTSNEVTQVDGKKMVDGEYIRAGLGFFKTYFIDGSFRTDRSSTLPKGKNRYPYWSASGAVVLSELIDADWLNFWKVRGNYAEIGNDTSYFRVFNTYAMQASFGSVPSATNPAVSNNLNLEPERTKGWEVGMEASMLKNRISFDVSYYNSLTYNLLTQIVTTGASGNLGAFANAGDIRNKGIEATLKLTPIRSESFSWDIAVNWAKNDNEVEKLNGDAEYYQLASPQGDISIGAFKGQPLGVITGTDYVYDDNGNRIVGEDGYYLLSEPDAIIGNMNPEWTGGIRNTLNYKNLTFSFLIDIQQGGDIFSLDTWYGYSTGLYDVTAGLNDLGNPVRNSLENGGGVILPGVKEDGSPNDIRVSASNYDNPWGYVTAPNKAHVYDASFVKLRNVTLSYDLPEKLIKNSFIKKFTISAIGRNLWIIHKNIPYSDPESGLSAGNIQGYQSGAYPTIREIGASVKVQF